MLVFHMFMIFDPRHEETFFFCVCENKLKGENQMRGSRSAGQRLCFRYIENAITLSPISEISSPLLSYVAFQPGLYGTWSETPNTVFFMTRLIHIQNGT